MPNTNLAADYRRHLVRRWYREGYKVTVIAERTGCTVREIQQAVHDLPLRRPKTRKKSA